MKKILSFFLPVILVCACSSPKYTYYFDHYDYNSGRKTAATDVPVSSLQSSSPGEFIASTSPEPITVIPAVEPSAGANKETSPPIQVQINASEQEQLEMPGQKYQAMTTAEKRAFRQDVKRELKELTKKKKDSRNNVSAATAMDNDLRLAIIFGAVGLTLSLFSGINAAFWVLGVIAIVVGVVFLIRWLVRQ